MTHTQKTKCFILAAILCLPILLLPLASHAQIPVTLTWSTNTYVPISYMGKAIPTIGSKIEVVAIIENSSTLPEQTIYQWSLLKDFYLQKRIEEQNKPTFNFTIGDISNQIYSVELEIKDASNGNVIGQSEPILIKPANPQIIIHPKQVSDGIKKTLAAFDFSTPDFKKYLTSSNQTVEFTAMPYFFNIDNISDLDYTWLFGNKEATQDDPSSPNIFKLNIGEVGNIVTQNLKLYAQNRKNPLQRTDTNAQIILNP